MQAPLGRADPVLVRVLPGVSPTALETWIVMHEEVRTVPWVRAAFDRLVAGFTRCLQ